MNFKPYCPSLYKTKTHLNVSHHSMPWQKTVLDDWVVNSFNPWPILSAQLKGGNPRPPSAEKAEKEQQLVIWKISVIDIHLYNYWLFYFFRYRKSHTFPTLIILDIPAHCWIKLQAWKGDTVIVGQASVEVVLGCNHVELGRNERDAASGMEVWTLMHRAQRWYIFQRPWIKSYCITLIRCHMLLGILYLDSAMKLGEEWRGELFLTAKSFGHGICRPLVWLTVGPNCKWGQMPIRSK